MPDLYTLSDHHDIRERVVPYSSAIDSRDFDALDTAFTPDAAIDYRTMGGIAGRYPDVKAWLRTVLPRFPRYQHLVGNLSIRLDGDTARGRTICFNPMEVALPDGGTQVMFLGLWYVDRFVRTAHGSRIAERVEARCYGHNVPAALAGTIG
ncbi:MULTISPECIES: nuclear transport factor 2 family protein [Burkholderia]|uniref:SnoaL-like domain-containing protein n=1 Tax=Burkholderia cenocepacia TaxID=95486 RepID=A0A1V2VSF1_9BURK|nr:MULTISPECIES: nuclear transport factor 2 family protein [Burkholderia]MBR8246685.1 nuclear transport factor 2 family protein [Burkholderia cenocepacia]MBR8268263.1 nuclear transport factor 2 family protein [Burkholderia cenocepacia]MBR8291907.1 nuclear transport factor 2 family protein [Burkholderia cenocepacia]MBR8371883.1 nuclear transport factor 2 family protein [Burkholderia cenocepacia]MBR8435481.1 nuclear transport factor 2 family protein [Burkholderia cenocepacia]